MRDSRSLCTILVRTGAPSDAVLFRAPERYPNNKDSSPPTNACSGNMVFFGLFLKPYTQGISLCMGQSWKRFQFLSYSKTVKNTVDGSNLTPLRATRKPLIIRVWGIQGCASCPPSTVVPKPHSLNPKSRNPPHIPTCPYYLPTYTHI